MYLEKTVLWRHKNNVMTSQISVGDVTGERLTSFNYTDFFLNLEVKQDFSQRSENV